MAKIDIEWQPAFRCSKTNISRPLNIFWLVFFHSHNCHWQWKVLSITTHRVFLEFSAIVFVIIQILMQIFYWLCHSGWWRCARWCLLTSPYIYYLHFGTHCNARTLSSLLFFSPKVQKVQKMSNRCGNTKTISCYGDTSSSLDSIWLFDLEIITIAFHFCVIFLCTSKVWITGCHKKVHQI